MRAHSAMALMAFRCQRRCQRSVTSSQLSKDIHASYLIIVPVQLPAWASLQPINA